jgi:FkbM family methyltransferase
VEYVKSCIADREGEVALRIPKRADREKLGKGSLVRNTKEASAADYRVRAVTLDEFLGDASSLPNAMRIDVEGALAHVFAGAGRTLRNCQALYVEMESSGTGRHRWLYRV